MNSQPVTVTRVEQLDPQRETVFRIEVIPTAGLPLSIVVKQQRTEQDGAKDFKCEKEAYSRLQELQGEVIPHYLGEGSFYGVPALFLSEVVGSTLYDLARNKNLEIDMDNLKSQLEASLKALTEKGALYWDQRLSNFLFCNNKNHENGKVMIIDLEQVTFPEHPKDLERGINLAGVRYLLSRFRDTREPNRQPSPVRFWYSGKMMEPSYSEPTYVGDGAMESNVNYQSLHSSDRSTTPVI